MAFRRRFRRMRRIARGRRGRRGRRSFSRRRRGGLRQRIGFRM